MQTTITIAPGKTIHRVVHYLDAAHLFGTVQYKHTEIQVKRTENGWEAVTPEPSCSLQFINRIEEGNGDVLYDLANNRGVLHKTILFARGEYACFRGNGERCSGNVGGRICCHIQGCQERETQLATLKQRHVEAEARLAEVKAQLQAYIAYNPQIAATPTVVEEDAPTRHTDELSSRPAVVSVSDRINNASLRHQESQGWYLV